MDSKLFRKGTWAAEIVDVLKPELNDIVVEGKRGLCGFASANLDFILRSWGITNVAPGGFLTNCCVESTMRSRYERGYQVVTLKDCTATLSEEEQRLAVEKNYPMFSRPMEHNEFLAELGGAQVEVAGWGYSAWSAEVCIMVCAAQVRWRIWAAHFLWSGFGVDMAGAANPQSAAA